ncbi:MAG TPA: DUF6067 family protein [Candidatus Sumerlaeota bacterium]|nr:DUF6067 family protein [Candidatus Sumerlaeota bacterium]
MRIRVLLMWVLGGLAPFLPAATPLFDFETDAEVSAWKSLPEQTQWVKRSPEFATSGVSSLVFATPAWRQGQAEWPAFEVKPPVADWSPYDRLVVDLFNPDREQHPFGMFCSDSKVPFRQGLSYSFSLPIRGFRRFVIPLASFPPTVNRADIAILHFFTERPKSNLTLYLDNLTLLRAGESLPEPGTDFVRKMGTFQLKTLSEVEAATSRSLETARPIVRDHADLAKTVEPRFKALFDQLKQFRGELTDGKGLSLERIGRIQLELERLSAQAEGTVSLFRSQVAFAQVGRPYGEMLVGTATSMEKVLPKGSSYVLQPAREVEISLARREKESFQVLVQPTEKNLKGVSVQAGELKSATGSVLKRENIQCEVTGYVETKSVPPYGSSHVGWWPDPILNFLGPVEIASGDVQSFWIRVCAPEDQPAGEYQGTLTVSGEGVAPVALNLRVRVRAFTLSRQSPLPLAITFAPTDHPRETGKEEQAEWRKSENYPVNVWKKHKTEWVDFLADYYLTYDNLYHHIQPDFEMLARLRDQGRLGMFNLGYFGYPGSGPEAEAKWREEHLQRLRQAYDEAKKRGLLDHAYIYGCDEVDEAFFPAVQKVAGILRQEFPDALLMTTTRDPKYGVDSVLESIQAFCPLTPKFDTEQAVRARATGRQVWWYICCGPLHPYANMFIEFPAIEGRLLMGAMSVRMRPDGFLYYQTSIWNSRKPIESGPFTDWEPISWTTFHGDGSWICVGPDGRPLPTVRLENFRDGLDDYAYAIQLEKRIRETEKLPADGLNADRKQWLQDAKQALPVPEALMKSLTEFSLDPAVLYAWRNRIGDLLDSAVELEKKSAR